MEKVLYGDIVHSCSTLANPCKRRKDLTLFSSACPYTCLHCMCECQVLAHLAMCFAQHSSAGAQMQAAQYVMLSMRVLLIPSTMALGWRSVSLNTLSITDNSVDV